MGDWEEKGRALATGLFFCVFALCAQDCGRLASRVPSGFTEVHFFSSPAPVKSLIEDFAFEPPYLAFTRPNTDLMIFALDTNAPTNRGQLSFHDTSGTGTFSGTAWPVPYGTYYFYAIGYDQANMAGTSTFIDLACGKAIASVGNVAADGTTTLTSAMATANVSITMTKGTATGSCGATPFRDASNAYTSLAQIAFCSDLAGGETGLSTASVCSALTPVRAASSTTSLKGIIIKYSQVMPVAAWANPPASPPFLAESGISSPCINVSSGGLATTGLPLPIAGDPAATSTVRLQIQVQVFSDTACTSANYQGFYLFDHGLSGAATATWQANNTAASASIPAAWAVDASSHGARLWLKF